ncbi:MAG: hypothetical protein GWN58_58560 [Anaerolineae bacterium]|nr:hypothetical protein [Anaerolineae bacterium]
MDKTFVIGVDPGQSSAGISVFSSDGSLVEHATVKVWCTDSCADAVRRLNQAIIRVFPDHRWPMVPRRYSAVVYCEIPQNGTHASRGGVHWAGGMLLMLLRLSFDIRRRDVRLVKPDLWRRHYGKLRKGTSWKAWSKRTASRLFAAEAESDDEAEAILIGAFGAEQEGGKK